MLGDSEIWPTPRAADDDFDDEAVQREIDEALRAAGFPIASEYRIQERRSIMPIDWHVSDSLRQSSSPPTAVSGARKPDPGDQAESPIWVSLDYLTPDESQDFRGEDFRLL